MKKNIIVIGGGVMGRGIVLVLIKRGYKTAMVEISESVRDQVDNYLKMRLSRDVEKGRISDVDREKYYSLYQSYSSLDEVIFEPSVVIEAVPEILELKQKIMKKVFNLFPSTIFASNTSSIPIKEIAGNSEYRSRVIGMHWFNPPPVRPLIEIIVSEETDTSTREKIISLANDLRKESIVVNDFPGFATSRLGVVIGLEAIRMLEQGVASAEDIDKAMVLGYGFPMGPLELTDLVGLDTRLHIAETIADSGVSPSFLVPDLLRRKVQEGKLGKKTGEGFYRWIEGEKRTL